MMYRELFDQIMHYGDFDTMPVIHWARQEVMGKQWDTLERWCRENELPADFAENQHRYLKAIRHWINIGGVRGGLYPGFDYEVLEETAEYRIVRDNVGVTQRVHKGNDSVALHTDHLFKTAKDWDVYKKRLLPCPDRIPCDIDSQIRAAEDSGLPIAIPTGSLMGAFRNWMGLVNFTYLIHDNRDTFVDMVDTVANLHCWLIDQIVPRMRVKPSLGFGWEDICGVDGPLVSPTVFKECVQPGYRRIRNKLEEHGITLYGMDSDGDVSALVEHWLDAGVNLQFPLEIGKWQLDPMEYRKKYGRDLRIVGAINKLAIEKGPAAIDAEINSRIPLMKEGGYIPMPDHFITPDTTLANYRYYLRRIGEIRL